MRAAALGRLPAQRLKSKPLPRNAAQPHERRPRVTLRPALLGPRRRHAAAIAGALAFDPDNEGATDQLRLDGTHQVRRSLGRDGGPRQMHRSEGAVERGQGLGGAREANVLRRHVVGVVAIAVENLRKTRNGTVDHQLVKPFSAKLPLPQATS